MLPSVRCKKCAVHVSVDVDVRGAGPGQWPSLAALTRPPPMQALSSCQLSLVAPGLGPWQWPLYHYSPAQNRPRPRGLGMMPTQMYLLLSVCLPFLKCLDITPQGAFVLCCQRGTEPLVSNSCMACVVLCVRSTLIFLINERQTDWRQITPWPAFRDKQRAIMRTNLLSNSNIPVEAIRRSEI